MKRKFNCRVIGVVALIMALMSQMAGCGGGNSNETSAPDDNASAETSAPDDNASAETSAPDDSASEETDVPVNGKINKVKTYELKKADNDKMTFELFYRDGSDYVAKITGGVYVPTGSSEYESMLTEVAAFQDKVNSLSLSEDIMHFRYNEVKLENGYLEYSFLFSELDAENSSNTAMVAEFLGLPVQDEYLELGALEQFLTECGFTLTHEM